MMEFFLATGSFILGMAILIYGADSLIRGASSIATKVGLAPIFIGLTVVAFGTSMPELVVNLLASFRGSNDIAIGNVIGSNIANILLILGVAALLYPLSVLRNTVVKEIPFSFLAIFVVYILANDAVVDGYQASLLSRGDGLILLGFFVIFMYYTIGISRSARRSPAQQQPSVKTYSHWVAASMTVGGIIGLALGGNFMVEGAVTIARVLGLSEALIGLTIVAVGTSLPELATSAMAAWRHHSDIAIGNIVGSNIFNIFWILGISAVINPLSFSVALNIDALVLLATTALLFVYMFIGKRNVLQRWQGASMLGLYTVYIIYLVMRG